MQSEQHKKLHVLQLKLLQMASGPCIEPNPQSPACCGSSIYEVLHKCLHVCRYIFAGIKSRVTAAHVNCIDRRALRLSVGQLFQ